MKEEKKDLRRQRDAVERDGRTNDQWIKPNPITPVGLQLWPTGTDRIPKKWWVRDTR